MIIKPELTTKPMIVCWLLVGEDMRGLGLGCFLLKFACLVQKERHKNTHLLLVTEEILESHKIYLNRKFVQVPWKRMKT